MIRCRSIKVMWVNMDKSEVVGENTRGAVGGALSDTKHPGSKRGEVIVRRERWSTTRTTSLSLQG